MASPRQQEASFILAELRSSDGTGVERLLPPVYDELRSLDRRLLRTERPGHTLQPTALVHERACASSVIANWKDRAHFIAIASELGLSGRCGRPAGRRHSGNGPRASRLADLDPRACLIVEQWGD